MGCKASQNGYCVKYTIPVKCNGTVEDKKDCEGWMDYIRVIT